MRSLSQDTTIARNKRKVKDTRKRQETYKKLIESATFRDTKKEQQQLYEQQQQEYEEKMIKK